MHIQDEQKLVEVSAKIGEMVSFSQKQQWSIPPLTPQELQLERF